MTVYLSSSRPDQLRVPTTVTIPAGETALLDQGIRGMRGGDWRHPLADAAVWSRGRDWPGTAYINVGFRCARDLK